MIHIVNWWKDPFVVLLKEEHLYPAFLDRALTQPQACLLENMWYVPFPPNLLKSTPYL
jgi:hypothetical protein